MNKFKYTPPSFLFLPFLDVLVSAIGVFIIVLVILIQYIKPSLHHLEQADALVIIYNTQHIEWYDKNHTNTFKSTEFTPTLAYYIKESQKSLNIVIAIDENNFALYSQLSQEFAELPAKDKKGQAINFRIQWWPVYSKGNHLENLKQQWLGENSDQIY